jgi:hypothetical protein
MSFERYHHVERLGHKEVAEITFGTCHVFPKLDGANGSVWAEGEDQLGGYGIRAGSRNRTLGLGKEDNHGFYQHVLSNSAIVSLLSARPDLRLHGEWLVPHTLKTYREAAWRQFYVFDVQLGEELLPFEQYAPLLDAHGVKMVHPMAIVDNPTEEDLRKLVEQNTYLIEDGAGVGEGIVIKRYGFRNGFGRVTWAKIVRNEFKEQNGIAFGTTERDGTYQVEVAIVQKYVTATLVAKERAKIEQQTTERKAVIPRLLQTVFYELIREESWNFVKDHKNPTINYRTLKTACDAQVKRLATDLF